MARINRSDVIQKAVNDLALSASDEIIPNQTLDKVQCVYSLNKQFSTFLITGTGNTTGTTTVAFPTVSAGGEIFITNATMSLVKDATCDLASGRSSLTVVPDLSNVATAIGSIVGIALTADAQSLSITFPYPLKIKNGSSASFGTTFSLGVCVRAFTLCGFTTSSN